MKTVFSHNFATFLISFSNVGTSVFAFSIFVLYNFYFFTVQKIRVYKKRKNYNCSE